MRYAWGAKGAAGQACRGRSFITVSLRWESLCHILLTFLLSHTCNFLIALLRTFFLPTLQTRRRFAFSKKARNIILLDMQNFDELPLHARKIGSRSFPLYIFFFLLRKRVLELARDKIHERKARRVMYIERYYLNRGTFPHADACNVTLPRYERKNGRTDRRTDSVSERSQGEPEPPL